MDAWVALRHFSEALERRTLQRKHHLFHVELQSCARKERLACDPYDGDGDDLCWDDPCCYGLSGCCCDCCYFASLGSLLRVL